MAPMARKESKSFVRGIPKVRNVNMSYEDTLREMEAFLDGKLGKHQIGQHAYVDVVTETTNSSAIQVSDDSDPDATEYSSSFGDTMSGNEITSVTSDAEVESEFRDNNELGSMFDSFGSAFPTRKKKITTEWRNYIRPLMWRCKWTELKIKELESQTLKYNRELEKIDQTKMSEPQNTPDFCSKSSPFPGHPVKGKLMKRRKRKLVENVTDISSYMSNHNIFSYFERKESDSDNEAAPQENRSKVSQPDSKNDEFSLDNDWMKCDEDSMDQILRHIGSVHSQLYRLKNHLDNVLLKNRLLFSSSENLTLLPAYDVQTSGSQSPIYSPGNIDMYAPQSLSDFDIGDLDLPESIVSGCADVTQIPDIIESTVRLMPAEDVTVHQPHIVESAENILDDTPMQTNVTQGQNPSHIATHHSTSGCQDPETNDQTISAKTTLTPDLVAEDGTFLEKSTLKSCITSEVLSKNKRKRGERKAAPGGWNLKSSGDHDNN